MPPSKTSSKRKLDANLSDNEGPSTSKGSKKARTENKSVPENSQPTNKVLPVNITFPPREPGTVRLATWNICGLAASQKKGFKYYVEAEDPDILVLTETKVNDVPNDPALTERFPHAYWSISNKKSYSGTAILSKHEPLNVTQALPGHPDPSHVKGRIITLEFDNFYVVGTYVVNAGSDLKTLNEKKEWNVHFDAYIRDLDSKKPVIWTGDLNVAPTEMDLSNPKKNWNKTAGYTEAETTAFKKILASPDDMSANKFVDVWRQLHPTDRHYTYFSYRFNCRMKGIGWRLDICA